MKIKRYKKVNRHINFYVNNFGFRQPYQMLIDGTLCYAALKNQINIADNIPRYLQGEVKLLTTQCILIETENLGAQVNGALVILKKYALHKCGHEGKPIPGANCILSMIGKTNKDHYIVATQDRDLQKRLRNTPGVPLLYLHLKTPVLDPPTQISSKYAQNNVQNLFENEKEKIDKLKIKCGIVNSGEIPKKRKKKGPNPLSCKKKQKIGNIQQPNVGKKVDSTTKKKKLKKVGEHVMKLLKSVVDE